MNASPRRHLSAITADLEGEYNGELKTIPAEAGTLVFECEIRHPPSSEGRTIYVFFQGADLVEAMKLLKAEAIRARSKPMAANGK